MSITRATTYAFFCDDGRYCSPNWGRLTVEANNKVQAFAMARASGWAIRREGLAQCRYCKRRRRISLEDYLPDTLELAKRTVVTEEMIR